MGKRFWSLALSMALIGGVFSALPAQAQEATVPATVQITDPFGDANALNDQGGVCTPSPLPAQCTPTAGDNGTPTDAGNASDIGKVWFTDDATTVSANIQTELPPPGSQALRYYVYTAPGEGSVTKSTLGCARFVALLEGKAQGQQTTWRGPDTAKFFDACNDGTNWFNNGAEVKLQITTLADGTGLITITADKSLSPFLATGQTLGGTTAMVQVAYGATGTLAGSAVMIDNTKVGTDYVITGGSAEANEPTEPTVPGKGDPPGKGKKKGCDSGKGKKKGACPGKKAPKPPKPPVAPAGCAPYAPGEEGKDAGDAVLVTDAATAAKPVETTVEIDAGVGVGGLAEQAMHHAFKNIQVDPAAASAGLYVRLEMPVYADYDLYVNNPDGTTAARAAGFNPAPQVYNDTEMGGHTEQGAEMIDGLSSSDCQGYTLRVSAASAEGGELTIKLWFGEEGGAGGSEALSTFYTLTGLANPSVRDSSPDSVQTPAADKGCKKGKGKKKGCTKPPVACAPFTPGPRGADKPTVTLTDAATEAAPLEQKVTLESSVADVPSSVSGSLVTGPLMEKYAQFNVQIDSANPSVGLYALFEFPERRDYDLDLLHPDSSFAARSHDFNPVCGTPLNCSNGGHGGEAGTAFEKLVGIATQDCGGWTVEAVNWLGEGGEFTVKLWLGEVTNEPLPAGEEKHPRG